MQRRIFISVLSLFLIVFVMSCGNAPDSQPVDDQVVVEEGKTPVIPESTQMLVSFADEAGVAVGKIFGVEYQSNHWQITYGPIPCSFGKNGFAELEQKFEGDGRSPSGMFPIGAAFGYEKDLKTALEFIELQDHHYWVSDTSSALYNQLIEYDPKDDFSEKMRRSDHLYKYGVVIEYNTQDVQKGKGSAIFIHIERSTGAHTAGCIAMSESDIISLIQWLKPQKKPNILMGTKAYVEQELISREMNF